MHTFIYEKLLYFFVLQKEDTSIRIKRRVKDNLENLDFVRKQSDSQIVGILIEFYLENKVLFEKQYEKNKEEWINFSENNEN